MTTAEKFKKLGNAIKRYRGRLDEKSGKWIQGPDRNARADVCRWLDNIGIPAHSLATIDGFKSFAEYRTWMAGQQAAIDQLTQARRYS